MIKLKDFFERDMWMIAFRTSAKIRPRRAYQQNVDHADGVIVSHRHHQREQQLKNERVA